MSLYEKVPASVNFVEREKQTEKFWHDNDIFRKSMEQRKGDKTYTFYDGPPTANGKPPHRSRSYPSYQGYDSEIPHNEGL